VQKVILSRTLTEVASLRSFGHQSSAEKALSARNSFNRENGFSCQNTLNPVTLYNSNTSPFNVGLQITMIGGFNNFIIQKYLFYSLLFLRIPL